jgi:hypothetical protein
VGGHIIGHSKQKSVICTSICALFRTVSDAELYHYTVPTLLARKRDYVLFLISVFTVQVTKLVQFTKYNTFSKIPPSVQQNSSISGIVRNRTHVQIHFLLRMTDTMTSQNIELSSCGHSVYTVDAVK